MKTYALIILTFQLSACSLLQIKIDPESKNTVKGFEYKYPKTGEWILGKSEPGIIIIGKKNNTDEESVLVTVRSGPIGVTTVELAELKKTGKLKAHSTDAIISSFKSNIEADAKQGRVKNIKTLYEEKKSDKGSCLMFSQTGVDNGIQPITNDGKWCFNSKTYSYIMLNISARVQQGKKTPNLTSEKAEFFDSLIFSEK